MVARDQRDMARAFAVWSGSDQFIDPKEFLEVVPVIGEDLTEEEISALTLTLTLTPALTLTLALTLGGTLGLVSQRRRRQLRPD